MILTLVVTPFTGVWIEIVTIGAIITGGTSHPSRVCGLKFPVSHHE